MKSLSSRKLYGYRAHQDIVTEELTLTGKYGEVFEYDEEHFKVLVWNSRIAMQMNNRYKQYPQGAISNSCEPVFKIPLLHISNVLKEICYAGLKKELAKEKMV